jgi:DNA topoisomerase-2
MATDLSKTYQHKTEIQHILDRPNVYIGSIHVENDEPMWIETDGKIETKPIQYIPALYKLFDEGIVNCRDHAVRMKQSTLTDKKNVTMIDISVADDGTITMINDGDGLDVAKHPDTQLWIPEMIFGHLRTSTNYAEEDNRILGGQNGLGFKLVLIWSTYGYIETVDHRRGLKYTQEFINNLGEIKEPTIVKIKDKKPYTKIVFKPDYRRFGIQMTPDMISLFHKRTIDICALTDDKIKVSFNGTPIPVKNFQKYVDMYIAGALPPLLEGESKQKGVKRIHENPNERWEYIVALSPTHEFQQVSFVNGICTYKGGKHVDYIMGKITRELVKYIEKKKKVKVSATAIKEQLFLFLKCDIENPSFDSQSKDCLNTTSDKFGSACDVSDGFIEKIAKMGVMDLACSITQVKEENKIAKTTDGKKGRGVHIDKYSPANFAGTAKSKDCVLILCEGDSAKAGVVSGLEKSDRDIIGIMPLRGKVMNIRGTDASTISKNKEITDIKQILGLENGREYKTIEDVHKYLNYSKIMILCDSDVDGSHIKGLLINLFDCQWSSLLQITGFISYMNTPILRATKGNQQLLFYHEGEYQTWKQLGLTGYTIKYFKGLGTSTGKEFKEYFANKKIVNFECSDESKQSIDMAFNKDRADDRKQWLEKYDKHAYLDTSRETVKYEEFIDKELIHFSIYNCERSIPNMMDGMKTSQRKILYSAFKRNLIHEIKVAQFSGYVSEHSSYHHGEVSLQGAIIGMAQNYVGSNNINILVPGGQFGTRCDNGGDHASPRYIYTQLNSLTRLIYPKSDDAILSYLEDDGQTIEPEFYTPIIPMILINGSEGIGMGYSSEVVSYHPKKIIEYLRGLLNNAKVGECDEESTFFPYYEGFQGKIERSEKGKFLVRGIYTKISENAIRITELPVGMATNKMIELLKDLSDVSIKDKAGKTIPPIVKDYKENNTDTQVDIVVEFMSGVLTDKFDIEKTLKLTKSISTSNMYLFDPQCKLKKYKKVEDIIDEYYGVRLNAYTKRKNYLIKEMERELLVLSNRARYILAILEETIDLRKKTKVEITQMLESHQFDKVEGDFEYLVKMRMDSVSKENVERLLRERDAVSIQLVALRGKTVETIWLEELAEFEQEYDKYKISREILQKGELKVASTSTVKTQKKKVVKN